jgi:hypothetical protein
MVRRVALAVVLIVLLAVIGCSGPTTDATAVAMAVQATLTASAPTATWPPTDAPAPTPEPTPNPTHTNAPTIEPPTPTPPEPALVTGVADWDPVVVRDGPGESYPIIGELREGDVVRVLGRNKGMSWYQIAWGDSDFGWVEAYTLKLPVLGERLALVATPTPRLTPRATPTPGQTQVRATASAQARFTATAEGLAKVAAYRKVPPKGIWCEREGGITVCAGYFDYFNATDYYTAGAGNKFVKFSITVYNNTADAIHVNPFNVTLVDLDNRTYSRSSVGYTYFVTPLEAVDVQPGDHASGGIMFSIKSDSGPARVVYESFLGPTVEVGLRREPDRAQ